MKWVRSKRYGLLNIELAWMWWGFLKDNEHSEHTSLWKKMRFAQGEQYGLLNIELDYSKVMSAVSIQIYEKLKWVCGKRYGLLKIELAWRRWGLLKGNEVMIKFEVGVWWAIWIFDYWISLNAVKIIKR